MVIFGVCYDGVYILLYLIFVDIKVVFVYSGI